MQRTAVRPKLLPNLIASLAIGLGGFAFAADSPQPEPNPFYADDSARPISQAAAEPVSGSNLRWQSRSVNSIRITDDNSIADQPAEPIDPSLQPIEAPAPRSHVRTAARPQTAVRAGWNVTRIDPSVRPAQATSDPFNDPFGDRQADHREPMLMLRPTDAEVPVETLPPPRSATPALRPAPPRPLLTAAQPQTLPVPQTPEGNNPLAPPGRDSVPCDRVYNDRNCCDLENKCGEFRERLLADSIRFISLDITPRYSPDLPPDQEQAERADKLRLLESRVWKNRRGQVVATGKLTDLRNNNAIISDDNGNEVGRVSLKDLGEDELCYVTAWWSLPTECGIGGLRSVERQWIPSTFAWHASALCHKPLYFEQVQLERYGHTAGPIRQPFISGAHFFLSIAVLPYKMAINPPHECQYALGYYRPGSCAPWMIPPVPLSLRGAMAETGAVLGAAYLIP